MLAKASGTLALQASALAMGFATTVLLARLLGAERYGRYVFALAWASVMIIPAILGLDRFLVRGIATYEVRQRWDLMKGLLRRTNQLVLCSSLLIAGGGWIAAFVWLSPSLRWPFCVAMLLIPVTCLTLLRQGAMQAYGRVVTGQLPEYVVRPVLLLLGIGALDVLGGNALTPTTALAMNVAGVGVAFAVGVVLLKKALPSALRESRAEYRTREWLAASMPMMLVSGIWATNSYLTIVLVGVVRNPSAAGIFSVVQKGGELIVILLVAANMSLAPVLARLHANGERLSLEYATQRVAKAAFIASTPIAAGFLFFPGIYLDIFGAGFGGGSTALTLIAVGQLVNAAAGPAGNVLLMTGHERLALRGIAMGLLTNLVLGLTLIPPFGVTGAGIAFTASLVVWNVALVISVRRRLGINATAFGVFSSPLRRVPLGIHSRARVSRRGKPSVRESQPAIERDD
jgi:O-antigen/teichoic acid export membrane protein